ncbi:glycoside hydrolase family 3 C-terminal domain-containing protein [Plantactinospora mayteni]|uniref:Sugar hydrolase n=1 Tax=Plantactinospora mayteni TaxID=566021 RepID=A0ABQ4EFK5_9ACTN|nr:glycoside hydrolase family 3 protein [Plantactinospora mayteni]GIG93504.1 sugar hydrolase [Plantactinospora mayteni]
MKPEARAESILRRLTFDEKVAMLYGYMPRVDRLGVGAFNTGGEAVHGVVASVPGTVFPQAVGLGATWHPELLEEVGAVIGTEVDLLLRADPPDPMTGRNLWAPVVNLLRDPRWGRNEEGYSEDPLLTVRLAVGFCRGLRGEHDRAGAGPRWRTAPTLKHFLAYNHEVDKFTESVDVRPRVLHEYDLRPFLDVVREGVVAAVMPSFSLVNGRPNHLSEHLRILREADPDLVVVADGFAPSDLVEKTRYYDDRAHAYPAAIRAGLDSFTDHFGDPTITLDALHQAVTLGLLCEEDVTAAARRLLRMRARLGEFDEPPPAPDPDPGRADRHAALARQAVRESVVLLRNDGLLPLRPGAAGEIAVVGPLADRLCRDWYGGQLPYRVTPLDGIREQAGGSRVTFEAGVDRIALRLRADGRYLTVGDESTDGELRAGGSELTDAACFDVFDWGEGGICLRSVSNGLFLWSKGAPLRCNRIEPHGWDVRETFRLHRRQDARLLWHDYTEGYAAVQDDGRLLPGADPDRASPIEVELVRRGTDAAAATAAGADTVVLCVGTYPHINGREMLDRQDVGLPPALAELARTVIDANPDTVVALISGHPLAVPELAGRARALLWSAHGGQEFGNGLADVIFGACSPAGRLPQSWPRSVGDLGDITDYDIIKSRLTYLYSDRQPLYPFGHGLSYSSFDYGALRLDATAAAPGDRVTVSVDVTNVGDVDADEVVQLYLRALKPPLPLPRHQLHAFRRVHLPAAACRAVELTLAVDDLGYWDVGSGRHRVAPGPYEVMVGGSSAAIARRAVLTVTAPPPVPRDVTGTSVRAVDFDDYQNVRIVDEARLTGEAVEARSDGAWLLYRDADLGRGPDRIVARMGGGAPGGQLQVRLGDPAGGHLLGVLDVPTCDGRYEWRTVEAPLAGPGGRHDLYLVLPAGARLASFALCPPPEPLSPEARDR